VDGGTVSRAPAVPAGDVRGVPAGENGGVVSVPAGLVVRGLAYAYPDGRQALAGVDLDVAPGERLAILGPNGAGKTTLVLHLNGILGPDAGPGSSQGSVLVGGVPVTKENLREVRQRVGLVFQDPDDQLFMPTVGQDVGFGPANLGVTGDELAARVARALAQVDMSGFADRAPYHLSFGQRRRVAVATVLAMQPDVVVLDEPSSTRDPAARRELADVLRTLDVTLVMVTHDLPYALELCPRAVVLSDGVVVADGPTRDLLADEALMAAHRLELPYGFDPRTVPAP
jgi:cobalt/nickel transport system ATP-binding protein